MKITAFKTHPIIIGESLTSLLDKYLPSLAEQTVLCITSKIISLCQGRVIPKENVAHKYDLIQQEADGYLPKDQSTHKAHLTIKNHILIPSAGIDESNGDRVYILYPSDIQKTVTFIWEHIRQKQGLREFGVVITDSHTTPLRKGVTGIALGWCGFEPLYSYVGKPDIFGHPLRVTQINILDALATAAVFEMGEGSEQTPLALIEGARRLRFLARPPTPEEESQIHISLNDDIYAPLLRNGDWIWNRKEEEA